jgi:hypothetical protein
VCLQKYNTQTTTTTMSILFQIRVKGPSCLVNGPYQGYYDHSLTIGGYLDMFRGDKDTLSKLIEKKMKALYYSDWEDGKSHLHCRYTLIETQLSPNDTLLPVKETVYSSFAALCDEIVSEVKKQKLTQEKQALEERIHKIDEILNNES